MYYILKGDVFLFGKSIKKFKEVVVVKMKELFLWEGGVYDQEDYMVEFLELLLKFYFLIWVIGKEREY